MASLACAAPPETQVGSTTLPTYHLRGYYKLDNQRPAWTASDAAPWAQVKSTEPWVNKRLLKWGYLPFTHDSKNYYCVIDEGPRTGSLVIEKTFMCGDPATAQWLFQNNWRPSVPQIGGGPSLESSERASGSN
jgi:hypothetical protein